MECLGKYVIYEHDVPGAWTEEDEPDNPGHKVSMPVSPVYKLMGLEEFIEMVSQFTIEKTEDKDIKQPYG